ncbi:MAG: hypothetical protein ACO1OF_12050 [Adhaeribacter sp.]
MKKALRLLIVCSWLFQFCSSGEEPEPPKRNYLSFKMNGVVYTLRPDEFNGNSFANNNFNIQNTTTVSASPFQFDIRKVGSDICGIIVPKNYQMPFVNSRENCTFDLAAVAPDGSPLPPENVYYYQSGNITFTKTACGPRPAFNILCLCTQQTPMCDLSGTFELTFKNGLNETVTLSEGKILMYGVFQ